QSPRQAFTAYGTAVPGVTVTLSLKKGSDVIGFSGVTDLQGKWSITYGNRIPGGTWQLTAQARDARGAESDPTTPALVQVTGWLGSILRFLAEWGLLAIVALLLIAL